MKSKIAGVALAAVMGACASTGALASEISISGDGVDGANSLHSIRVYISGSGSNALAEYRFDVDQQNQYSQEGHPVERDNLVYGKAPASVKSTFENGSLSSIFVSVLDKNATYESSYEDRFDHSRDYDQTYAGVFSLSFEITPNYDYPYNQKYNVYFIEPSNVGYLNVDLFVDVSVDLTTVPIPNSAALLGSVLLALSGAAYARRRSGNSPEFTAA